MEEKAGRRYKTISANGTESHREGQHLTEVFRHCQNNPRQVEERIHVYFPDEMVNSILEHFDKVNPLHEGPLWNIAYGPWGGVLWYDFKCCECDLTRKLTLKHWLTVHEVIEPYRRHCVMLGLTCYEPSTEMHDIHWDITHSLIHDDTYEYGKHASRTNPPPQIRSSYS